MAGASEAVADSRAVRTSAKLPALRTRLHRRRLRVPGEWVRQDHCRMSLCMTHGRCERLAASLKFRAMAPTLALWILPRRLNRPNRPRSAAPPEGATLRGDEGNMTVRPTPPDPRSRKDSSRIARAPAKASGPRQHQPAPTPLFHGRDADSIESLSEARALRSPDEREPVVSGALSNERMLRVSQRWAAGHYDRPDVVEALLGRLLSDL